MTAQSCGGNNSVKTRNPDKSLPWVLTSQNALLMGGKLLIGRFLRPFYWAMNPWNNLLLFSSSGFRGHETFNSKSFQPRRIMFAPGVGGSGRECSAQSSCPG